MSETANIAVNGEMLIASPLGALFWPAQATLIVADLHFEKGSAFARRGVFLPPYDTRTTLNRLAALCRQYEPRAVISLGDAFHDGEAEARFDGADAELLASLSTTHLWTWVLGNHDENPPQRFPGEAVVEQRIGALVFRHEPSPRPAAGELSGHLHPCARIKTQTGSQRRRCFASDGERLVMPAFGAYAGGLNVLDTAFAPLFDNPVAFALGARGVYPFSADRLLPDANAVERNGRQNRRA